MAVRLLVVALTMAIALGNGVGLAQPSVAPPSPYCIQRSGPPAIGLEDVGSTHEGRWVELTLRSTAVAAEQRFGERGEQRVRVLLPSAYDPSGATRYPVLYAMHALGGSYRDYGEFEEVVGDRPVIVVMPDGGGSGWYSDWYGKVAGTFLGAEPPAWETYHTRELIPYIDKHFPTIAAREGRAIIGFSMGGHGAMKYAARHPDLFLAAMSVSGVLNITQGGGHVYATIDQAALNPPSPFAGDGAPSQCKWGDPYTQEVVWQANNPYYLASNLHGVSLWISSGDGTHPDDPDQWDPIEYEIRQMHHWFVSALDRAQVPYTSTFRPGTHHDAAFFWNDVREALPWLMDRFADPPAPPSTFSLRSSETTLGSWGWSFEIDRDVKEFTYVEAISAGGFAVSGSGLVHVITPAIYQPRMRYAIRGLDGPLHVLAGEDGRLRFDVDLGPSHQMQQYRFRCGCWGDLDSDSGLVDLFGDDPEMRADWITRTIEIEPAPN